MTHRQAYAGLDIRPCPRCGITCGDGIDRVLEINTSLLTALMHCHDWILSRQTPAHEGETIRLEARAAIDEAIGSCPPIKPQHDPLTTEV